MGAEQYNEIMVWLGILTLLLTILGWSVTAYFQKKVLEQQTKTNRDLESLKFAQELALSNRELKLEILPTANTKMIDAYSWTEHLCSAIIRYPDFDSFSSAQLQEVVKLLEFTETQKEELLGSPNKNKYYKETQFWYDAKKASDLFNEFHNYLIYKKLFIDDELFAEFASVEFALNNILAGIQYAKREHDDSAEGILREKLNWDVYPVMQKIEKMIKDRINQNFPLKMD